MSFLLKRMADVTDQSIFILEVPGILVDLSKKYQNIKSNGMKTDKLSWDKLTELYVLNLVLKHGIELVIKNRFSKDLLKELKVGAL